MIFFKLQLSRKFLNTGPYLRHANFNHSPNKLTVSDLKDIIDIYVPGGGGGGVHLWVTLRTLVLSPSTASVLPHFLFNPAECQGAWVTQYVRHL